MSRTFFTVRLAWELDNDQPGAYDVVVLDKDGNETKTHTLASTTALKDVVKTLLAGQKR